MEPTPPRAAGGGTPARRGDAYAAFSSGPVPRPPQRARAEQQTPPRSGLLMNGGRANPLYAYSSYEEGEMEMMAPAPPGGVRLVRPYSAAQAKSVQQRQVRALYGAPAATPKGKNDTASPSAASTFVEDELEALNKRCKESCVLDYAMGADDAFAKDDSYEPGYYCRVDGEAPRPKDNKFTRTTTFAAQDGSPAAAGLHTLQDVIRFFADPNRDQNVKFVHLTEADTSQYSPYDLAIADLQAPNEPHYIFSATGVVHCCPGKPTEVMNLSAWIREASLFSVLRRVAFFRTYIISKAFKRWYRTIRKVIFRQTRAKLARQLLFTKRVFAPVLCTVHDYGWRMQKVPCISLTNRQERSGGVSEIDVHLTKFRDAQHAACGAAAKEISAHVDAIENTLFDCCEEIRQRADVPDAGRLEVIRQYVKSQMDEEGLATVMTLNVTRTLVARHVREIASRHNTVIQIPPAVPSVVIQGTQTACQNAKADLEDLLGHPIQVVRCKAKVRSMAQEKANILARMSNIKRCMEEAECLERLMAVSYHIITQHLFKFALLQAEAFRSAIRGDKEATSIVLNVKICYKAPVTTFLPVEDSIKSLLQDNLKAISDVVSDTRLLGSKLCLYTEDVRKRLVCAISPNTDFRFTHVVADCAGIVGTAFENAAAFVARFSELHAHWKFLTDDWKEVEKCWSDPLSVTPEFFKQLLSQLAQIKADLGGMYNKSFGPIQIAMLLAKDEVLPLLHERETETGRVITRTWRRRVDTLLADVQEAKRTISDTSVKLEKFAALSRAIRELEESIYLLVAREEESEVLYDMIERKGYSISAEDRGQREALVGTPTAIETLRELLSGSKDHHANKVKMVIAELEDQMDVLIRDLLKVESLLNEPNVTSRATPPATAQGALDEYDKIVAAKERQIEDLVMCQEGIGSEKLSFTVGTREVLESRKKAWSLLAEWNTVYEEAHATGVTELDVGVYKKTVEHLYEEAQGLNELQELDVTLHLVEQLEEETRRLPLIEHICNPCMKADHWKPVFEAIQRTYVPTATYTVQCLLAWNLAHFAPLVAEQSELATGQAGVEKMIDDLERKWDERSVQVDTQGMVPLVSNDEKLREHIEDSFLVVKQLMNSEYIQNMHLVLKRWVERLTAAEDCLTQWIIAQTKRADLQLIAGKTPLVDPKELVPIDVGLKEISQRAQTTPSALKLLTDPKVIGIVQDAVQQVVGVKEQVDYQLNQKRKNNPRLYTVAADMYTLVNPKEISGMFPSLADMCTSEDGRSYTGVVSHGGEKLMFHAKLSSHDAHGDLLTDIDAAIRTALKHNIAEAIKMYNPGQRSKWMFAHVNQAVQIADEVAWVKTVEQAMKSEAMAKAKRYTDEMVTQTVKVLQQPLSPMQRLAAGSVLLLSIHRQEKVERVLHEEATRRTLSVNSFAWRRNLRYQVEPNGDITLLHANAKFAYGYEYYGCRQRLVQTPQLDRTFLQFSMALHGKHCPYVAGPPETGKSELVADYAYAVGRQLITVNCVVDTDVSMLVRTVLRVAQAGSWLFIDDLEGLSDSSLAVVTHLVSNIMTAAQQEKTVVTYRGSNIPVRQGLAVFYSQSLPRPQHRIALSQKIKHQVRTVSLHPPDLEAIIYALAMCAGLPMAQELATKMKSVLTFFAASPLTPEDAKYRFGMRGVRAVFTAAAALRAEDPMLGSDSAVVLALRQLYVVEGGGSSEFNELIESFIKSAFPFATCNVEFPTLVSEKITSMGYVAHKAIVEQVAKARALLSTGAHLILLGAVMTGKTTCLKITAEMSNYTIHPLVAGAYPIAALFGSVDKKTRAASGGILTHIFTSFNSGGLIVIDGWCDAVISVLHPILDGQTSFRLGASGEQVKCPLSTSIVVETDTLARADPGMVTRFAMICSSSDGLGPKDVMAAALEPLRNPETEQTVARFVAWDMCCDCYQSSVVVKLLHALLEESPQAKEHGLLFAMVLFQATSWGMVIHSDADRKVHRKSLEGLWVVLLPSMPIPKDFYAIAPNLQTREFGPWDEQILANPNQNPFDTHAAIERDNATLASLHISRALLKSGHSVLLNGPAGCGKSTVLHQLMNLMKADYVRITPGSEPATTFPLLKGKGITLCVEDLHLSSSLSTYEWLRQLLHEGRYYKIGDSKVMEIKVGMAMAAEIDRRAAPNGTDRLFNTCVQLCLPDLARPDRTKALLTLLLQNSIRHSPACERLIQGLEGLVSLGKEMLSDSAMRLLSRHPNQHYVFHFGTLSAAVAGFRENIERTIKLDDMFSLWYSELSRVFVERCTSKADRDWARVTLEQHSAKYLKQVPTLQAWGKNGIVPPADLPRPLVDGMPEVHLDATLVGRVLHLARMLRIPSKAVLLQGALGSGRRTLVAVAAKFAQVLNVHFLGLHGAAKTVREVQDAVISAANGADTLVVLDADVLLSEELDAEAEQEFEVAVHSILSLLQGNLLPQLFTPDYFGELARLQAGRRSEKSVGVREAVKRACHTRLRVMILVTPQALPKLAHLAPQLMSSVQHYYLGAPGHAQLTSWGVEMMSQCTDPSKSLAAGEGEPSRAEEIDSFAAQCADLHVFASAFAETEPPQQRGQRVQYTAQHYAQLIEAMGVQNLERRVQLQVEKLTKGVDIIRTLERQRDEGTSKLDSLVPNLEELADQNDIKYKIVEKDTQAIEEAHNTLARHEQILDTAQRASADIADVIEQRLGEVLPAYQSALQGVRGITKKDIDEILFIRSPSAKLLLVMESMLAIFAMPSGWDCAKKLLVDSPYARLEGYNLETNYATVLDKAKKYVENPDFLPGIIRIVNPAASVYCQWVRSAYAVAEVFQELEPLQAELASFRSRMEDSQANVDSTSKLLEQLELTLLQSEQAYKEAAKEYLNAQDQRFKFECTVERATVFVDNLHDKVEKWELELTRLQRLVAIPKYFVFHTAAAVYAPPLGPEARTSFLAKLQAHLGLPPDPAWVPETEDPQAETYKHWESLGLPTDAHTRQSAFFVTTTRNVPLLVDPHHVASVWLRGAFNGILEATTEDVDVLHDAARNGLPIVVHGFKQMTPELAFYIDPNGERATQTQGLKVISAAEGFRLFLCAAEPFYHPRIENVDFSVLDGAKSALAAGLARQLNPKLHGELVLKASGVWSFATNLRNLDATLLDTLHKLQGSVSEHPTLATDVRANITTAKFEQNELDDAKEGLAEVLAQMASEIPPVPPEADSLFVDLAARYRATQQGMYNYSLRSFVGFLSAGTDFQLLVCSGLPRADRLALWLRCELLKAPADEVSEDEANVIRQTEEFFGGVAAPATIEIIVRNLRARLPSYQNADEGTAAPGEQPTQLSSHLLYEVACVMASGSQLLSPAQPPPQEPEPPTSPTSPLSAYSDGPISAAHPVNVKWVIQHDGLSTWGKVFMAAGISLDAVYEVLEALWDPLRNFHLLPMLDSAPVNTPVLLPMDAGTADPVVVLQHAAAHAGLPEDLCVVTAHEQPFKEVFPKFQAALHLGTWILLVDAHMSPGIVARLCAELRMTPMEGSRFRLFIHCPIDTLPTDIVGEAMKLYLDKPRSPSAQLKMATYPLLPQKLGQGIQRPKLLHRVAALHALLAGDDALGFWDQSHLIAHTAMTDLVVEAAALPLALFTDICGLAYSALEPCLYKRQMLNGIVSIVLGGAESICDTETADAYVSASTYSQHRVTVLDNLAAGGAASGPALIDSVGNAITTDSAHEDCITRMDNGQITPMTAVLYNELAVLNKQIVKVNAELAAWHRGEASQEVTDAIKRGVVPRQWHVSPAVPDAPIAQWLAACKLHVRWFHEWVVEGPPPVYWLPAFHAPEGLYQALKVTTAHEQNVPATEMKLVSDWTPHADGDLVDYMPNEGLYVWGFSCEHGTYDPVAQTLRPDQNATSELPVLHAVYRHQTKGRELAEGVELVDFPVYATEGSATTLPTLPTVTLPCAEAEDGLGKTSFRASGTRFLIHTWKSGSR